jgi:hypothetical protein
MSLVYIIFLNVHVPTEDESHDIKDSFFEEQVCVFDQFRKYNMNIFGGDFVQSTEKIFSNQQFGRGFV